MGRIIIPGSQRKISHWAGGSSSQICIWPENADYSRRDFLFRISTATADSDELSPYTSLPGVTRHLLMLEGTAQVEHKGHYSLNMTPYKEIDTFDGGWESCAKGKVRDFNLMCRENSEGRLSVCAESGEIAPENADYLLLFCSEGQAELRIGGEKLFLKKEDALFLSRAEPVHAQLAGESRLVCAHVWVK